MASEQDLIIEVPGGFIAPKAVISEVGDRAFPRYADESLTSPIPPTFTTACSKVKADLKLELSERRYSGLHAPERELALRLLGSPFFSGDEAFYALNYAGAISEVKKFRAFYFSQRERMKRASIAVAQHNNQGLGEYCQRFGMTVDQIIRNLDLLPLSTLEIIDIQMVLMGSEYVQDSLQNNQELARYRQEIAAVVGIPAFTEEKTRPNFQGTALDRALSKLGQKIFGPITYKDLTRVRATVNDYFSSPGNISRINYLASLNQAS